VDVSVQQCFKTRPFLPHAVALDPKSHSKPVMRKRRGVSRELEYLGNCVMGCMHRDPGTEDIRNDQKGVRNRYMTMTWKIGYPKQKRGYLMFGLALYVEVA
jgi:hypothetical protein